MRRFEVLDTLGLATVCILSTIEAATHFGLRHDGGLCLGVPLAIVSALMLVSVHWPHRSSTRAVGTKARHRESSPLLTATLEPRGEVQGLPPIR